MSTPRQREAGLFAAGLVLGQLLLFHRALWSGLRQTVGDYVNHLLINFQLEHSFLWLLRRPDHASLWDPPVFYPARGVLAYAENFLGVAPLYWPLRLAGLPPDTAYQVWVMVLPALSFAAAWFLFRGGFGFAPLPAAIGALFSAYGASLGAQINNPQLHTLFFSYFALFCLCRLFRADRLSHTDCRPGWTALFFAAMVGQLYACFYMGWMVVFLLGLTAVAMLLMAELRPQLLRVVRANLVPILVSAVAAALVLLPLVRHALAVVRDLGWSNETASSPLLPQVISWLYPGRRSIVYFWLGRMPIFTGIPAEPEQRLALGLATTACAAAGLWQGRKNPWSRLAGFLAIGLVLLLTEWPGGFSLWQGVRAVVPGARALRYVSRAGVLLVLPAAVGLAAFFAGRFADPSRSSRRGTVLLALLGLCIAEQAYSEYAFSKARQRADIGRFAAAIDRSCPSFYMTVRPTGGQGKAHWIYGVEIMMAQTAAGVPAVNGGYTRFAPPGYGSLVRNVVLGPEDEARIGHDLAAWQSLHHLGAAQVCRVEVDVPVD